MEDQVKENMQAWFRGRISIWYRNCTWRRAVQTIGRHIFTEKSSDQTSIPIFSIRTKFFLHKYNMRQEYWSENFSGSSCHLSTWPFAAKTSRLKRLNSQLPRARQASSLSSSSNQVQSSDPSFKPRPNTHHFTLDVNSDISINLVEVDFGSKHIKQVWSSPLVIILFPTKRF